MRYVLSGATGLIGGALLKRLSANGHTVEVISRNPEDAQRQLPEAAKAFRWDSDPESDLAKAIHDADGVIHLSGSSVAVRWNDAVKQEIYSSRIDTTALLAAHLKAAELKAQKPRVFLCASGIGFYGNSPHGKDAPALTESSPEGADFLAQVCVDWEKAALSISSPQTRVACIRTGIVLSTKGGALAKMITPFKLFAGGPLGSGQQWFPWIHLDDEVGLFVYALSHSEMEGPINAVAPYPVLMSEFATTLGKVMNRPALFPVPYAALVALFGEAASAIAEGQHAHPEKALRSGFQFSFPTVEGALRDILTRLV